MTKTANTEAEYVWVVTPLISGKPRVYDSAPGTTGPREECNRVEVTKLEGQKTEKPDEWRDKWREERMRANKAENELREVKELAACSTDQRDRAYVELREIRRQLEVKDAEVREVKRRLDSAMYGWQKALQQCKEVWVGPMTSVARCYTTEKAYWNDLPDDCTDEKTWRPRTIPVLSGTDVRVAEKRQVEPEAMEPYYCKRCFESTGAKHNVSNFGCYFCGSEQGITEDEVTMPISEEVDAYIDRAELYALDPNNEGFSWHSMNKHERKAWRAIIQAVRCLNKKKEM